MFILHLQRTQTHENVSLGTPSRYEQFVSVSPLPKSLIILKSSWSIGGDRGWQGCGHDTSYYI